MPTDYSEGQELILKNYSSIKRINRSASRATPGESHATTGDSKYTHHMNRWYT